jgi:hypothetical protein
MSPLLNVLEGETAQLLIVAGPVALELSYPTPKNDSGAPS